MEGHSLSAKRSASKIAAESVLCLPLRSEESSGPDIASACPVHNGSSDERRSLGESPHCGDYESSRSTDGVCRQREDTPRGCEDRGSHEKGTKECGGRGLCSRGVWLAYRVSA